MTETFAFSTFCVCELIPCQTNYHRFILLWVNKIMNMYKNMSRYNLVSMFLCFSKSRAHFKLVYQRWPTSGWWPHPSFTLPRQTESGVARSFTSLLTGSNKGNPIIFERLNLYLEKDRPVYLFY